MKNRQGFNTAVKAMQKFGVSIEQFGGTLTKGGTGALYLEACRELERLGLRVIRWQKVCAVLAGVAVLEALYIARVLLKW